MSAENRMFLWIVLNVILTFVVNVVLYLVLPLIPVGLAGLHLSIVLTMLATTGVAAGIVIYFAIRWAVLLNQYRNFTSEVDKNEA